jgi:hypothetical protein
MCLAIISSNAHRFLHMHSNTLGYLRMSVLQIRENVRGVARIVSEAS